MVGYDIGGFCCPRGRAVPYFSTNRESHSEIEIETENCSRMICIYSMVLALAMKTAAIVYIVCVYI